MQPGGPSLKQRRSLWTSILRSISSRDNFEAFGPDKMPGEKGKSVNGRERVEDDDFRLKRATEFSGLVAQHAKSITADLFSDAI